MLNTNITALNAGPTQLIAALCDQLNVEDTINTMLDWHPSYWKVSPGTHVKAMIINFLCSRSPLYQVEDFYEDLDVEMLFGSRRQASDFNDDALARVLDLIHKAESWKVYSNWSMSVLQRLGLALTTLHNDTTSISVTGQYPDAENLNITFGYSKDKRPDLKQIVMGLGVTPERLPVFARVEDGNKNDKTWNFEFITRMRTMMSEEQWADLTYVADSALVTPDNLALLMEHEAAHFISRLPDTYDLGKQLKQEAIIAEVWEEHGTLGKAKGSSQYRSQTFIRELYGRELRFVVLYSSQLYASQVLTLERALEKESQAMKAQIEDLTLQTFDCNEDASSALVAFRKQHRWKWHECTFTVEAETYTKRRASRGRPKAGTTAEEGIRYRIHAEKPIRNEDTITAHRLQLGMFVLMTNRKEEDAWPNVRILQAYKGQDAAETRFRLLKSPSMLNAVYIKTPSRIEALGIVFIMALMVYGVLEWRVREQLKQEKEPLVLPGKRKSHAPTGESLLLMLRVVQVILIRQSDGQVIRQIDSKLQENKIRLLRLAGFDESIYTTPR
jgi:transposase